MLGKAIEVVTVQSTETLNNALDRIAALEDRICALEKSNSIVIEGFQLLETETKSAYGLAGLSPLFRAIAERLEP